MIQITSQPPGMAAITDPIVAPIALSDCMNFCLQPDAADVFLTTGTQAELVFTIPFTCTVPANGTAFKLWGYSFTIQSAEPFTSESFKVDANGLVTVLNLANMLAANVFFKRTGSVTSFTAVGTDYVMIYKWNECREQINFTGTNMDFLVFGTIGGNVTKLNGISPSYVEAYRIIVNTVRYQDNTLTYADLSALAGMEAEKLCDRAGIVCVDIKSDVSDDLYTMMPPLTYDSFISSIDNGRSMMRFYSLQYGWTYRQNCIAKSGTIKRSNRVLVLNAAFDIDDPYQIRRYWSGHPQGFPPGQLFPDFLTTQPKTIPLCKDSYKWLWFLNSFQGNSATNYALVCSFDLYDKDNILVRSGTSVVNNPATMGSAHHQPVCFNASPRHISDILNVSMAGIVAYEVQLLGVNRLDFEDVLFNASEYLRFEICDKCCEDGTDLYFLSPTGSIDTFLVRVDSLETLQSGGEEITVNLPCGASRTDRATNGGRTLTSTRVYQKMKLSAQIPRSKEWERWVKHLRQSPQRWIRVMDESGAYIAKKIVFENGGITQRETGQGVTIEMTGYLMDIPTQQGNEKRF